MKLASRLKNLESNQPIAGLSKSELTLLVQLLGRRDSLFWPWRYQSGLAVSFPEIYRRQREYLNGSVGLSAKADGRSNWKHAHEVRQKLLNGSYITANFGGGQVLNVHLTLKGEALARALVGPRLKTYDEFVAKFVYFHLRNQWEKAKVKSIRESVIWGKEFVGCPSDWDDLTENMLPWLACGCVRCHSDTQGRACFAIVDSVPIPEVVKVDAKSDPEFESIYLDAFASERHMLSKVEARDPNEIVIFLPATGWGWPCYESEICK